MKTVKLKVNGREVEVEEGTRIIEATKKLGLKIPHYCYHAGLSAPANCRMCLVEVTGQRKLIPSCSTPCTPDMEVQTETDPVKNNQAAVMEFMLLNHPLDCPTCDQAGECKLQDYGMEYGFKESRMGEPRMQRTIADFGPEVKFWGTRCVVCTRCVRFTEEISGTNDISVVQRGRKAEVAVFPGAPIDNKLSGNVVDICPVGALLSRDFLHKNRPWFMQTKESVCATCSKGCNIKADVDREEIQRIRPRKNMQVNQWWMCDIGRMNYKYVNDENRLHRSFLRDANGAEPRAVSREEAVRTACEKLQKVRSEHGPGSIGGWAGAWATHEENFLLRKLIEGLGGKVYGYFALPDGEEYVYPKFTIPADRNPNRRGAVRHALGGDDRKPAAAIEAARKDGIKALYGLAGLQGFEPDLEQVDLLRSMDALILHDFQISKRLKDADVTFAALTPFEKRGLIRNEQEIDQELTPVVSPPGEAAEDWTFLQDVARGMGLDWNYSSLDEVREEMKQENV